MKLKPSFEQLKLKDGVLFEIEAAGLGSSREIQTRTSPVVAAGAPQAPTRTNAASTMKQEYSPCFSPLIRSSVVCLLINKAATHKHDRLSLADI